VVPAREVPSFEVPTLHSGDVVLRPWDLADAPAVIAAAADTYIPHITTVPESAGEPEARAYIERQWDRALSGLGYSFAICAPSAAVGQIGLWPRDGVASIGYWLVPAARGRGLAARALGVLMGWASAVGYADLELFAEPWNEASLATARRCGFVERGTVRAHHQVGTEPRDAIRMTRSYR
jgi:RimJ/RimL family protein N-acetyltransferase